MMIWITSDSPMQALAYKQEHSRPNLEGILLSTAHVVELIMGFMVTGE